MGKGLNKASTVNVPTLQACIQYGSYIMFRGLVLLTRIPKHC
jgi:hypothetical protein